MFEEVGEAGFAGCLVGGADLVPDHLGDDRRAAIRDHDDLQAVGKDETSGTLRCHRGLAPGLLQGQRRHHKQRQAEANRDCCSKSRSHGMCSWQSAWIFADCDRSFFAEQIRSCKAVPRLSLPSFRHPAPGPSWRSRREPDSLWGWRPPSIADVFTRRHGRNRGVQRFLRSRAVGEVRRRRLVSAGRLGQRIPGSAHP